MILIITPENLPKVEEVFNKWKVDSKVIGKVIEDKILRVKENGKHGSLKCCHPT